MEGMNPLPGWYEVPGTPLVRWWDGTSFRPAQLTQAGVKFDKFTTTTPTVGYTTGALFIALGVLRLVLLTAGPMDFFLGIAFIVIGILQLIAGANSAKLARLPMPHSEPVWDARVMPMPGQTEPGPIAPGFYAAPSASMPRWWTGARWGEYLLVRHRPMPIVGQYQQLKGAAVAAYVAIGVLFVATALLVVMALGDSYNRGTGLVLAGLCAVVGIALLCALIYLSRVYRTPTGPPTA